MEIEYTKVKYINDESGSPCAISVFINGRPSVVPLDPGNADYAAVMSMVSAGGLTITPAS